jgi:hypothetical protein
MKTYYAQGRNFFEKKPFNFKTLWHTPHMSKEQNDLAYHKLLVNQFAEMIVKLSKETENALDRANSSSQLEKVLRLQAHVLFTTFQTLGFGIDTMMDEDLLRLWNPHTKTTTSRN